MRRYYPYLSPARKGESFAERTTFVRSFGQTIREAGSVLVGGGGPVACEMAAVCRELNPTTKITMVMSAARPIDSWEGSASAALIQRLTDLNIDLVANERVEGEASLAPGTYTLTKSGQKVEADVRPSIEKWYMFY